MSKTIIIIIACIYYVVLFQICCISHNHITLRSYVCHFLLFSELHICQPNNIICYTVFGICKYISCAFKRSHNVIM